MKKINTLTLYFVSIYDIVIPFQNMDKNDLRFSDIEGL
ncbi:hypothetical protein ADICYQ_0482 [Cyclobacterium qasimii M12-11B]|uniref:Uncharacterized protein n=1 Tax=Cyclobacterium qasimii M12-11B TaxID=641524 RepID=S7WX91_9BACT|nr:hypothetical protein ADICYQ_0482 [Cyclobacterium qasimii M12-11B]